MEQKVCLDTDVVIDILNDKERAVDLIEKISKFEVYISSITLFELLLRESNLDQIEIFRDKVKVLYFDELASRKASFIFKDLKKKGRVLDIRDLFIGSICLINNCKLATFNKKHFDNFKDLKIIY